VGVERRKRGRRYGLLVLALLGSVGFLQCGFRRDEVECEEAVRHVADCCGVKQIAVDCTYQEGCDRIPERLPDLSSEKSESLLDTSCKDLADGSVCESMVRCGRVDTCPSQS
jgi:hypothetical protein